MEEIILRNMCTEDLPQVHKIENRFYGAPWSIRSLSHELGSRDAILKVAACDNQIIGYICLRSLLNVTHLLKITVVPEFRRRGIGFSLLQASVSELKISGKGIDELTLEVRESNHAAMGLYTRAGFRQTGRRHGYYRRPDEDAVIMGLTL